MAGGEQTPMMRQYRRIKSELPEGVILLFRLGDFYEMFLMMPVRPPRFLEWPSPRGAEPPCAVSRIMPWTDISLN